MLKLLLLFAMIQVIKSLPASHITYAKQSDSPWAVWINIPKENRRCTGSLIRNEYILTVAHCFDSENEYDNLNHIHIYIGDWKTEIDPDCDSSTDESDEDIELCDTHTVAEIPPEKLFIHESYKKGNKLKDIALVKLMRPPRKSRYIKNITLRDEEVEIDGETLTITGFGEDKPKHFTEMKKITDVKVMNTNDCKRQRVAIHKEYQFCGRARSGITSCSGDSGGPVTSYNGEKHILEGILVKGATECVKSDMPSIFLKIEPFITWINNIIEGKVEEKPESTSTTSTTPEPECETDICD